MVMVKKQRGTGVVEADRAVTATAAGLQQTALPAGGLQMHLMHSDVNYVREVVGVVRENPISGAPLVG